MEAHADEAGIDLDDTYAYGPESYDATIIIALAAQVAGDRRQRARRRDRRTSPRTARSAPPTPTAWP